MKYKISEQDKAPAYLQLYRQLKDDIIGGAYPYNAKLPSKRLISSETGVSVVTAEHAYALLCDEGYIEPRERSGYYVIFREADGFAAGAKGGFVPPKALEHKSSGEGLSYPLLAKTMRRVISECAEAITEKPPNSGLSELREAISRYLIASRGISADAEQIIIGSGSEYLYGLVTELLGQDKLYAIEYPSYKKIEQLYNAKHIRYEMLPLGADGIESEALWRSNADVLHISPYRSYPSGVTAFASKRHEYLRWAKQKGRFIIEDDFESEFSVSAKPEDTVFSLTEQDNVIYMNTFSKTISPALRVGYMILPKRLLTEFEKKLGFYSCTVPTFEQLVLAELIANGDFERHINRVRRKRRTEV